MGVNEKFIEVGIVGVGVEELIPISKNDGTILLLILLKFGFVVWGLFTTAVLGFVVKEAQGSSLGV